jgi:L-erythro-3,5-diaminohexanoate dehydrogenase
LTHAAAGGWTTDADRLGISRSRTPAGALPHTARVLDADTPPTQFEIGLDAEMLGVDATSFAVIAQRTDRQPAGMARLIADIVAEHGKLQNPWTGSGGVVMGRVSVVGSRHVTPDLSPGELVVPLASTICVPLALESVGPVDPHHPLVPVRGRAIVTGSMLCARVPDDLGATVALTALDVYPVASHVREMAAAGAHVIVLGSGHAGLLAVAAARPAVGARGQVTVVDRAASALRRAQAVDSGVVTVRANVTAPLAVAGELARRGLRRADLTLLCTSAPDAEGTAILVTAPRGTVLFFSTATRFAAAALGADAIGSQPRLIIPNSLTDDRGDYAFALVRANSALRTAFSAAP